MGLPKGKWGVAYSCEVPLIKRAVVDFAVGADYTPAAGDVKVRKDGAAPVNIASLPTATASGNTANWDFSLSASEMQATGRVAVTIADAPTKAVEDNEFIVEIDYGIRSNTAQAGGNTSITLDASASATDSFYVGLVVELIGGTGAGQKRTVTAYVGSTKVVTVDRAWATNPDNTSIFRLDANAAVDVQTIKTQTVTCAAGVTVLASVGTAATSTAQTGDAYARLGAPAGASIAADLAEIEAETDGIAALPAAVSIQVWSEALPGSYTTGEAGYYLARVGQGIYRVISPVLPNGDLEIVEGDDYSASDGRQLDWTDDLNAWPTLTGAAITLDVADGTMVVTGSVVVATGDYAKRVRAEPTAAQTALLPGGTILDGQVKATLTSGRVVTLVQLRCKVVDNEAG